ncbi:hypothetical protein CERSUDRAFT_159199 [Gelatoporia subvermispora B]|uniref:Uncharacterized protein n=1 Tax=Ceriporiopsis subvermispora (strain B) TaxID=914234 RepID=M2QAF9_CERS8|nr:hypothetical protein CERSUDRAFT_159199 [Gelatoporia subvermispora B]
MTSRPLTIIGCTLCARLDPDDLNILRWSLSDFPTHRRFDPAAYQAAHARDAAWLAQTVANIAHDEPHRRVIVIPHHAPTVEGRGNPKYLDRPTHLAFAMGFVGGEI